MVPPRRSYAQRERIARFPFVPLPGTSRAELHAQSVGERSRERLNRFVRHKVLADPWMRAYARSVAAYVVHSPVAAELFTTQSCVTVQPRPYSSLCAPCHPKKVRSENVLSDLVLSRQQIFQAICLPSDSNDCVNRFVSVEPALEQLCKHRERLALPSQAYQRERVI